jgi:hypothetical protein
MKIGKKTRPVDGVRAHVERAELSQAEIRSARRLIDLALAPRGLPFYSPEERMVLAILAADLSRQQGLRGKKSKSPAKREAAFRRDRVNLLLRYVVAKKFRKDQKAATSNRTVMEIMHWLDDLGMVANDTQIRRDIHEVLKRGPL